MWTISKTHETIPTLTKNKLQSSCNGGTSKRYLTYYQKYKVANILYRLVFPNGPVAFEPADDDSDDEEMSINLLRESRAAQNGAGDAAAQQPNVGGAL